jgi:hypothetical protein
MFERGKNVDAWTMTTNCFGVMCELFTPNLLDLYPTIFLQGLNSYDLGDVKFCIVNFVKGTM